MPRPGLRPQTLAEIDAAIARIEAMIDGQHGLADRLRESGFEPVETMQLVEQLERGLAILRTRKAGRRYGLLS